MGREYLLIGHTLLNFGKELELALSLKNFKQKLECHVVRFAFRKISEENGLKALKLGEGR